MLINCPECGKEISDKAPQCIHCGFPLKLMNNDNNETVEQSIEDESTKIYRIAVHQSRPTEIMKLYRYLVEITDEGLSYLRSSINDCSRVMIKGLTYEQALEIQETLSSYNLNCEVCEDDISTELDHRYDNKKLYQPIDINTIKCPRCGSTAVVTGNRGVTLTSGFFGASKTMNRCGNCGYKWKP